jgi:hypothetical protein
VLDLRELDSIWHPPLGALRVAESGAIRDTHAWHWTERHLQCLWADDRLRPAGLRDADGAAVEVVSPGRWNLEAGPDFLDAVIKVGRRTLRGDVEVHIRPGDWNAHRHSEDPRYANVVLHVTWFPPQGAGAPRHLPTLALQEPVAANSRFSFDAIDLAAYPHAVLPDTPRPCGLVLADATQAEVKAVLDSAGMSRLRRKALRMALRLQATGSRAQVFYEEFMAALGYKPNAEPMRATARLAPLDRLAACRDFTERYALLLGVAGLLPNPAAARRNAAAARALWDVAWKLGITDAADKPAWKLGATRPANHPRSRLAVAAALFATPDALLRRLDALPQQDAKAWFKLASDAIRSLLDQARPAAPEAWQNAIKLGDERLNTILTNVAVPLFLAENGASEALCRELPAEAVNEQAAETAYRLLGRDHNPAFYATSGLRLQGLLEIFNGFCLATKSQCEDCGFARTLANAFAKDAP